MTYEVPNIQGVRVLIDDEDLDLLPPCGRVTITKLKTALGHKMYATRHFKGKPRHLHRFIVERMIGRPTTKGEHTDHINDDSLDNRRENLRVLSHVDNVNRSGPKVSRNSHGFKGVLRCGKVWEARIMRSRKSFRLGRFSNPEDAARAYDAAALELFGPLAYQNFKNGG